MPNFPFFHRELSIDSTPWKLQTDSLDESETSASQTTIRVPNLTIPNKPHNKVGYKDNKKI